MNVKNFADIGYKRPQFMAMLESDTNDTNTSRCLEQTNTSW